MSILINLAVGAIKPLCTIRAACTTRFAATEYAGRRAWKTGSVLAACTLIAVGVLAGCSSQATGPSHAAVARPAVSAATAAAARVFVSPHYGYTVALPAGWSAQAAQPFDGPGTPGLAEYGVDVFRGPPYVVA